MLSWIDASLYPDTEASGALDSLEEKIDFLARLCAAWDFGILPREETLREVCRPEWRRAVEMCRLLTSPAYHLLRRQQGLPEAPYLGDRLARIIEDSSFDHI